MTANVAYRNALSSRFKVLKSVSVASLSLALALPTLFAGSVILSNEAVAAVVRAVEVRGNKRIDAQTVRENVGIVPGRNFSTADVDEATRRLFAMGLFSDVSVRQSGNNLVVEVSEYEIVNNIRFQGNKKLKDADLEKVMSLKPREAFDRDVLLADEQTIREAYAYIGRNDVVVSSNVVDIGQGRVDVLFQIEEGKRTKIDSIRFEGNKAFGNRRLRDVIATKKSNMLSWLTRGDVYSEDRLAADEEALRRFYYNRGYADFRIISSSAVLDEATNKYTISFVIDEGARYRLGDIEVESLVPGIDSESVRNIVKTSPGDVYSAKRIEDTIQQLNDRVADFGYAFAKVEPIPNRDFGSNTISITYAIDQGPRAYVERIEVRGNNKTRDYVIRREFDFGEGDAFNQTLMQRAKRRLEGLGFFQTVEITTAPGSDPDQVVLLVDVTEKSTGEFSLGGGYTTGGSSPGASVEASITERNFLGRGQYVRLGAGFGQNEARNYSFSFTEPYFLGHRLSAGFDLFHQTYRMNDDYGVKQTGGTIRFGIPVTNNLTAAIAYNYSQEEYNLGLSACDGIDISTDSNAAYNCRLQYYPGAILNASGSDPKASVFDSKPWKRSSVSYGFTYNSIDNMKNPHDGWFVRFSQEYAGLGGDADYFKTTGKATVYKTLSEELDIVGLATAGGGYIHEIGSDGVRVFDMFKNNTDLIRGFKYNSIGPVQRTSTGSKYFLGGDTYMNASVELQFPMPIVPDSLGMRAAVFADAATLYGVNYTPVAGTVENPVLNKGSSWRSSAGVSLMWESPFGPLRFDYAWPIAKEKEDRVQNFNFGVSTKF